MDSQTQRRAIAAVLTQFNQPLTLQERPLPSPQPGEALIEITAAGVCGSDVHMWQGEDPRTPLPLVLGHEGVGRIAALNGEKYDLNREKLAIGDPVIWDRGVPCGHCYFCAVKKKAYLCPHRQVYGIVRYSTHLLLLPQTRLLRLPPDTDPAPLVTAACSGATAAHAVEACELEIGDQVVILGPGPVGLMALCFAQAKGASEVLVLGRPGDEPRLALCQEFGAAQVFAAASAEESMQKVMEFTRGRGAQAVIECTGSPRAVEQALAMTALGGVCSAPGVAVPVGEIGVRIFEDIVRKNVRLQGVWVSDSSHFCQSVSLMLSGRWPFEKVVSHRFSLEEATVALETVKQRQALKAVLLPSQ